METWKSSGWMKNSCNTKFLLNFAKSKNYSVDFEEGNKTNKPSSVSFVSDNWTEKKSLPKYF